jgi:protein SCO1/2
VSALISLDLIPGRDFEIVSISLDPRDKPADVRELKLRYVTSYGKLDTADGWHFLVGNQAAIEQAADACGIGYEYIPEQDSFSHPSAFIFCSAQGQIIRYLDGLDGQLGTKLKPAIIEAGEGRVGGVIDRLLYFSSCYEYDPVSGKYTPVARNIMKWASVLTLLALAIGLVPYWIGRRRATPVEADADRNTNTFSPGSAHAPREVHP